MKTSFVRAYAGPIDHLALSGQTAPTAPFDGNVVVCGRPFAPDKAVIRIEPDSHRTTFEHKLEALDGWFSIVVIGQAKAIAATDILGTGGVFLSDTPKGTIVASSLGRIATMVEDLDYDMDGAVAVLAGSILPGGMTPFRGIQRLQAGEYALIDLKNRLPAVVRSYADPAESLVVSSGKHGDQNVLMHLLQEAVAREHLGEETGLLLTAGKDSRAIGHALSHDDRARVTAYTYGGWRSVDRRKSGRAASEIGVRHRRIGPLALKLSDHSNMITRSGGGQIGLQVAQHLAGASAIPGRIDSVLTGYLGDVLTGKPWPESSGAEQRLVQTRNLVWLSRTGVRIGREFPDSLERVRQHLSDRLKRYSDLPMGRAGQLVDLTTRQATYVGGAFTLMHELVDTMTPFFNRQVMRYLLSLRIEDMRDQRLYEKMLESQESAAGTSRPSLVGVAGSIVDRRNGRYGTVNWIRVVNRERNWLRHRLAQFADRDRLAALGLASLDSSATLPLALFALPLVETRHQVHR